MGSGKLLTFVVALLLVLAVVWCAARAMQARADVQRRPRLRALLRATAKALGTEADLRWWIDFGTLLGCEREGDLILGDNDVDICVRIADEDVDGGRLRRALDTLGAASSFSWSVHRPAIHRVYDEHGNFVDVYLNRPDAGAGVYRGATGPNSDVPLWVVDPPVARRFLGASVYVPQHVGTMLTWRYGPDWRIPRRGYKGRDP